MLRSDQLEYDLPEDRIAVEPSTPRDAAKMMVVERLGEGSPSHRVVRNLPDFLRAGDVLVFNTTRVLPARFFGQRSETGGKVEGLFLHDVGGERGPGVIAQWCVMLRGGHLRPGAQILLFDVERRASGFSLVIRERSEPGAWIADLTGPESPTPRVLEAIGHTPLPPYIVKARQHAGLAADEAKDRERYQTVYAGEPGSVAAPTAGLHFTPELLESIRARGVERVDVVLHVGAGTFKPVECEFVEDHPIHAEWCSMSGAAVARVVRARSEGRRVIAVGTTAARTLETYAAIIESGRAPPDWVETRLLITPGYRFGWVEGLLTNFHLPRSTLLAMVGALLGEDGIARLKGLYGEAVSRGYRFYSYGDAMLIV